MKKIFLFSLIFLLSDITITWACNVCKKNQPEPFRNLTHGIGPQSDWDYIIIIVGIIIVGFTLVYSLKFLIKPEENNDNHVKYIVVDEGNLVN